MIWETYQMLPITYWPVRVEGIGEDMSSNMPSYINFEPLEFYWTYFLALQTTTPKIPPMRLMSLDYEPKNEMMCYELEPWDLTHFCVNMGFRRDSPKIHDSVDMVRVANEIKPYGVKNVSSTTCSLEIVESYIRELTSSIWTCTSSPQSPLSSCWW